MKKIFTTVICLFLSLSLLTVTNTSDVLANENNNSQIQTNQLCEPGDLF